MFKGYLTTDTANNEASIDTNVEECRELLLKRAKVGISKYGVTTNRTDLSTLQWLKHAREESLDFCVYLTRIINDMEKQIEFQTTHRQD